MLKKIYKYEHFGRGKNVRAEITRAWQEMSSFEILERGNDAPRGGKVGEWAVFGPRTALEAAKDKANQFFEAQVSALEQSDRGGYRGCGRVWYSIDKANSLRVLYMNFLSDNPFFGEYRENCRAYLSQFGEVFSGMASCCEIVDLKRELVLPVTDGTTTS